MICFRGPGGSEAVVKRLGARPVAGKVLYGIEPSRERPLVHETSVRDHRLVIVSECIWGVPQAAILVEELAGLGARARCSASASPAGWCRRCPRAPRSSRSPPR